MRDLSARTLDEVRAVPTERIKKALSELEKNLGGREQLAQLLAQGTFTSDEEKFVAILGDPEADGTSLAVLLGTFGLSPARFFKLLSEATAVKAVFASMDRVYRRLPDVAEHTMERAVPREDPCERCEGTGKYLKKPAEKEREEEWGSCGDCRGKGTVKHVPELDSVKLALQVGGLLKGGNTVNVTNQVDARTLNMPAGAAPPSGDLRPGYKDFLLASDRVLYGRAALPEGTSEPVEAEPSAPIEAEIVEESESV